MYESFFRSHLDGFKKSGDQAVAWCPFHADKPPEGQKGKRGFSVKLSTGLWNCKSCPEKGNAFQFAKKMDIPLKEVPGWVDKKEYARKKQREEDNDIERLEDKIREKMKKKAVIDLTEEIERYHNKLTKDKRAYFYDRGIEDQVIDDMKIGFFLSKQQNYFTFPYFSENGKCYCYRVYIEDKNNYWKPTEPDQNEQFKAKILFNLKAIEQARIEGRPLLIAEGEKDTLALIQAGYLAVGLPSANFSEKCILPLKGMKDIVALLDNDLAGKAGTKKLGELIPGIRSIAWERYFEGKKIEPIDKFDINDLLLNEGDNFNTCLDSLLEKAEVIDPYAKTLMLSITEMEEYAELIRERGLIGIDTGFKVLNERTLGLRGLNVLGGGPKVNKSVFSLQIARHLAKNKIPSLIFDCENGKRLITERILYSETKITKEEFYISGILDSKQEQYQEGVERIQRMKEYLRIDTDIFSWNLSYILEMVRHFKDRHSADQILLIFDSLQKLLLTEEMKGNVLGRDRRGVVDLWLGVFERIREETNAAILVISEYRRDSQGKYSQAVYKDSGNIEYTANTNFDLIGKPEERKRTLEVRYSRDGIEAGKVAVYERSDYWYLEERKIEKGTYD